MTLATLQRHISFLPDGKGKKVAVQFDLRNQKVKQQFEDLIDTLTVLERQEESARPLEK